MVQRWSELRPTLMRFRSRSHRGAPDRVGAGVAVVNPVDHVDSPLVSSDSPLSRPWLPVLFASIYHYHSICGQRMNVWIVWLVSFYSRFRVFQGIFHRFSGTPKLHTAHETKLPDPCGSERSTSFNCCFGFARAL